MKKLLFILPGIILNLTVFGQHFPVLYDHQAPPGVLDGTPISFLVTGYSTSHTPGDRPWPAFGEAKKGHILLQDRGDAVSFKNIKIQVIKDN